MCTVVVIPDIWLEHSPLSELVTRNSALTKCTGFGSVVPQTAEGT